MRESTYGRTPHGVRGLKYPGLYSVVIVAESHPSRGAWIEIAEFTNVYQEPRGRTPHGVRGLKSAQSRAGGYQA